jgi:hypothetical protein
MGSEKKPTAGKREPAAGDTTKKAKPARSSTAEKAKPKPARGAGVAALTPRELLERSRAFAAKATALAHVAAIEEAARRCVASGRADLAAELAAALPKDLQGPTLLIAARAGAGPLDRAIDAFLKGSAVDNAERPHWAARAFEAATALAGETPRAAELARFVEAVIEEALSSKQPWDEHYRFRSLGPLLHAQLESGARGAVKRVLERWMREDPESLHEGVDRWRLFWAAPDDPAWTLALMTAIPERDRDPRLSHAGLQACAGWPREDIEALAALVPGNRAAIGEHLVAAGRVDDARHILFQKLEEEGVDPVKRARRHLLLGETGAAKELLREPTEYFESTQLRIELGVESFAEARERLKKPWPGSDSLMSPVRMLTSLGDLALDRGDYYELVPILVAIERLLATKRRSHYDRGVEGSTRSLVMDLRARLVAARGDASAVREALESDLAALPALQAYGQNPFAKSEIARSLVQRAIRHGLPELALRAARKLGAGQRPQSAQAVAAAFLPEDPARALEALEALAGDQAEHLLFQDFLAFGVPSGTPLGPHTPLIAELWSAVLAAAPAVIPAAIRGV